MKSTTHAEPTEEVCIICDGELPPLNGVESNDFADLCEHCKEEQQELRHE